jgi:hypothetical protein
VMSVTMNVMRTTTTPRTSVRRTRERNTDTDEEHDQDRETHTECGRRTRVDIEYDRKCDRAA